METPQEDNRDEGRTSCFKTPRFAIYLNYILSSWGDRMWHFAVGLYLVYFDDGVLLLAAIYGFLCGGAILLLGGLIGQWVDNNSRMKVVRVSLFIQNLTVMASALVVCAILYFDSHMDVALSGKLRYVCEGAVIVLAIIAQLASVGYKIAIEKDWIVIIATGSPSKLANLNAMTRSMDLLCQVLAPTAVGQLMTFGSLLLTAVVIAGWNLVSVFVEYALLCRVYRLVPRLHYKATGSQEDVSKARAYLEDGEEMKVMNGNALLDKPLENGEDTVVSGSIPAEASQLLEHDGKPAETDNPADSMDKPAESTDTDYTGSKNSVKKKSCFRIMFEPCLILFQGWGTYARQKVVFAGISLAFLYMTVLGFDSITIGYMYAQGVTEAVLGAATAVAGLMGITGTFLFTRVRKRLGLERTGLIAFSAEICCLMLAVGSIWAPGSPFDMHFKSRPEIICNKTIIHDTHLSAHDTSNSSLSLLHRHPRNASYYDLLDGSVYSFLHKTGAESGHLLPSPLMKHDSQLSPVDSQPTTALSRSKRDNYNVTYDLTAGNLTAGNLTDQPSVYNETTVGCEEGKSGITISVIIFLLGIVLSRIGLWMADMSVNQSLQECVVERERGVVNGVQNSLNMLMDVIKFTMVILAPHIQTFGILIILSFSFIVMGGLFFVYHVYHTDFGRTLKHIPDLSVEVEVKPENI